MINRIGNKQQHLLEDLFWLEMEDEEEDKEYGFTSLEELN
jgi:hypothetical protein